MPLEWRFIARYVGSRSRCALTDDPRSVAEAAGALVDREEIDWARLGATASPSDGPAIQSLALLERLRAASTAPIDGDRRIATVALLLIAIGSIQAIVSLTFAFTALASDMRGERLPQLVISLAFVAASALLAAAAGRDARGLWLLAAYVNIAAAFARPAAARAIDDGAWLAVLFDGIYPEAFAPACLWQFAIAFPRVRRFTRFDAIARRGTAVAWIVGGILFLLNAPGISAWGDGTWLDRLDRNDPSNLYWSAFAILHGPAFIAIFVRSRRATPADRRRGGRLSLAIAIGTGPLLAQGFLRLVLPSFDEWMKGMPPERTWLDRVVLASLMSTPILGSIALTRDRPFGIRWLSAEVGVLRTLAATAWTIPLAVVLLQLNRRRGVPLGDAISWPLAGWCALTAVLFALRSRAADAVERLHHRTPVDVEVSQTLAHFQARIVDGEPRATIARAVRRVIRGARVEILVAHLNRGFVDPSGRVEPLPQDSALAAMIDDCAEPLIVGRTGTLYALLPGADREWIEANDVVAIVSLPRQRGGVEAVLLVQGPLARRITPMELSTLGAIASAAGRRGCVPAIDGVAQDQPARECRACGLVAADEPLACACNDPIACALPARLGRTFLVSRRIGRGGMGIVYLGRDLQLNRDVALKTLPAVRLEDAERMRQEARAMAALEHDGLATIYGLEYWQLTPVLIVEYFPCGTLDRRLMTGVLPANAALDLGIAIARALAYMHDRGVVHRDVKPGNIGLTGSGAPKLLDFGLTTRGHRPRTAGTPAYMSPEILRGATPTAADDVWALAVVMVEAIGGRSALTGLLPDMSGETLRAALGGSPAACRCLAQALHHDREQRFQSAADFLAALEATRGAPAS